MVASDIELRWDPGRSNWKRNQRRYVRPIVTAALSHAIEGFDHFGIDSRVNHVLLSRAVNTNRSYGVSWKSDEDFELYLRVDDIRYHKLASQVNFLSQVAFHESIHCARSSYHGSKMGALSEHAATEGIAYCGTQLFAAALHDTDEFDSPIDFIRTLPGYDLKALRKEVFEADGRLGVIPESRMGPGSDFEYWIHLPQVGQFSRTEVVGIHAVAALIDRGRSIVDLLPLPAEEILDVA